MSTDPAVGDASSAGPGQGVVVALAEFGALREEIVSIKNTQSTFIGVGLTAIGVSFGLALQESGETEILLAVPYVALILSLLHLAESFRTYRLGEYIRTKLWPYLQQTTGYPHSWESMHSARVWRFPNVALAAGVDGVVPVLYAALGGVGVWFSGANGATAVFGWLAVGLTLVVPAAMAFVMTSPPISA